MPDHGFTAQTALAPAATPVSRRRVRWGGAVLLVLLLAAGAAAWLLWPARPVLTAPSPGPQAAPPALTVALATVTAQSLARPVFGDGSVVAWQELVVGIETGGLRILEVPVEEGDGVRRGQLLARLDDALPAAQAAQAEAAVREAEAALAIAQSDLRRSTELARSESVARLWNSASPPRCRPRPGCSPPAPGATRPRRGSARPASWRRPTAPSPAAASCPAR
ncbi:biotin/lipoyl-binding protein [Paeniroseomonas aquatica]|uniref:biotin/lipoyl-binding protein n=1 Tax=Paeniroseomonas aquatica TaxID=373043 RepID=UPI00360D3EBA